MTLKFKFLGVIVAALFCFVSCAFGQGTVNIKTTGSQAGFLNYAAPAVLAFTVGVTEDHRGHNRDGGGGNGCSNQGGNGWGADDWGGGGGNGNGGGGCKTVPEGGSALGYLSLACFCCASAALIKFKRQSNAV